MNKRQIVKKAHRLNSKWWGGRQWYQYIELDKGIAAGHKRHTARAKIRTESFARHIPQVIGKDDRVLDIGCNAGLFSLIAAQTCRSVVGIEIDKRFVAQANFVKELWSRRDKEVSNVTFMVCDILRHLDIINGFDVIFASKVLYHKHLVHGLPDVMNAIRASGVRAILAQGHTTQGKHGTVGGMRELFDVYGFTTEVLEDIPEYPIVLGKRK